MRFLLALACVFNLLLPGAAAGQGYPDRPVRMIVPFTAGGGTDVIARQVAQKLTERWGQSVIVENRTGGNGNIGARFVGQSKPDGYTILGGSSALTINPWLDDAAGYELKDFTPVMLLASAAYVLVVNPKLVSATTVKEFVEYAKSKNGTVAWASASEGNAEHLAGMLFQRMGGFTMRHIPYKGGADAVKDVLGGHVEVGMISVPTSLPHLASGQLRAIGVTDSRRAPQIPDVPTIAESGVPGFELPTWYAVWVPAGTPNNVVDIIHAGLYAAIKQDDVQKRVIAIGFNPAGGSREEFADYVRKESEKFATIVRTLGLKK